MYNFFNFKPVGNQFLLTNDFGSYTFLEKEQFKSVLDGSISCNHDLYENLAENGFLFDDNPESFVFHHSGWIQESKNYIFEATQLHIFVVTTLCNHQCIYCQAQNGKAIPDAKMTKETARQAVAIALQSPAQYLTFEFQGGEPLLNFDVIKFIVEYSKEHAGSKNIEYTIVSNLTLLTDEILDFICENNICISTSLDGPEALHNINRPLKSQKASYNNVTGHISYLRKKGLGISALETTTRYSLKYPKEIVDAYLSNGFNNISLRPLTPLGCANASWSTIGYTSDEFIDFYCEAFNYILELNRSGTFFKENMASIFLKKVLQRTAINYMELRSPCGAVVGQMAYYVDGNIYTCDEGRMLAEMGDTIFRLGTVADDYDTLMNSKTCKSVCSASVLESLNSCSDCVYQPYCGVCPVINYALDGDLYEKRPHNYKCRINMGVLNCIFEKLQKQDPEVEHIFKSWIL